MFNLISKEATLTPNERPKSNEDVFFLSPNSHDQKMLGEERALAEQETSRGYTSDVSHAPR